MAAISRRRSTSWNLFFHYFAIVLTIVNGIVLVPLYLAKIPLETYGYWLATGNILAWLSLIDPGFSATIQQRVAASYGARDRALAGRYVMAAIFIAAALALGVALLGGAAGLFLQELLGAQSFSQWNEIRAAFSWAVAGTTLSIASFSLTAGGMGLQGALGPGIVYTVTQVSALALTVYWLYAGFGVQSLGFGQFVRGAGLCVGGAVYLGWRVRREGIACRFSAAVLRELLGLSTFTLIGKIPSTLAGQIDVLLAARFLGPEAAAMFGLTRRGYDVSRLLGERPTVAMMPAVAHMAGERNHTRLAQLVLRMSRMTLWALGLLFAGFVAFNEEFMRLWVGEGHYAGDAVNTLLALGMVLAVVMSSTSNLGFALGDIRRNSVANAATSLITICALWLSAWTENLTVVAAAHLLAPATIGLWYFPRAMSQRLHMTTADWHPVARECSTLIVCTVALVVIGEFIQPATWSAFLATVGLSVLLFAGGILGLSRSARAEAHEALNRLAIMMPSKLRRR